MSDKRIFRNMLSLGLSLLIAFPAPLLAQQRVDPPLFGFMGALPKSYINDADLTAEGSITRLSIEGREVTITSTEVTPQNAEAIADAMDPERTIWAVNDGPDRVHDMIKKKPWYKRAKDKVMQMGPVAETAAFMTQKVPRAISQKLTNMFSGAKKLARTEWKGVAYSVTVAGLTGGIAYYASGDLPMSTQMFGAALVFALMMINGQHQWEHYVENSGKMLNFIVSVGGRVKYSHQAEHAIETTGQLFGTFLVNALYALAMHTIDGTAHFGTWEDRWHAFMHMWQTAYLINMQTVDTTLQRWLKEGIVTRQQLQKYAVIPALLLGGGLLDGLNLNHVEEAVYISGTFVGAAIAYAYAGPAFEAKKRAMKEAYSAYVKRHRGFFRPQARAASLCAQMLSGTPERARPMPPLMFSARLADAR